MILRTFLRKNSGKVDLPKKKAGVLVLKLNEEHAASTEAALLDHRLVELDLFLKHERSRIGNGDNGATCHRVILPPLRGRPVPSALLGSDWRRSVDEAGDVLGNDFAAAVRGGAHFSVGYGQFDVGDDF